MLRYLMKKQKICFVMKFQNQFKPSGKKENATPINTLIIDNCNLQPVKYIDKVSGVMTF